MATFTIKRGDTAPPLKIALSIAGSNPKDYWQRTDDKPDFVGNVETSRDINKVRFILKSSDNKIVKTGASGTSDTGKAEAIEVAGTGGSNSKTVLAYYWNSGDTNIAGTYTAEFEVYFDDGTGNPGKKRTFPSTEGDSLIVNIVPDLNDEV